MNRFTNQDETSWEQGYDSEGNLPCWDAIDDDANEEDSEEEKIKTKIASNN